MKKTCNLIFIFVLFITLFFSSFGIIYRVNALENDSKFIVCIDAGHQNKGDFKTEPVAPDSSERKARVSSGATGISTKKPEYAVNLEAAMVLKDILTSKEYEVVMTRDSNNVSISNVERAQLANNSNANMTIRLHCDYIDNNSKTGTVILIPSHSSKYTKDIYLESKNYAEVLKGKLKENGIVVNGIFERPDITGFNWSKVPVIILEMGFMSNYNDDQLLSTPDYQKKLMNIVAESLDKYKSELYNNNSPL